MIKGDNLREGEALPDIYRVKSQYLDSYYNYIDNATSYKLNGKINDLRRCQGAILSLYKKLKWELAANERKEIEKLDINKFEDLEKAFDILSKKLKKLKVIDLKMRDLMGSSFK